MYEQFDFDTMGKVSNKAVKDKAREITMAELVSVITEHWGADFTSIVGGAEIAISAGSRTVDGCSEEVPLVISITAKEFAAHSTASGKDVASYDRFQEAKDYAEEKAAAEEKAREREEKKAKQIAASKAAREKDKARKAAKSGTE